jgi:hypothetical protein
VIDFRYHLVSLISVFLALAVGIVLGAGPLRENLGDQLAGQVEQLRTEHEQLRTEATDLSARNDQLASFITELGPELVAGTLDGAQVAVLTDDRSTRPGIDRLLGLLEEAGAEPAVRIGLEPALWEPGQEPARAAAVQEIRSIAPAALPADPDRALTDAEQLSAVIPALLRPADEGAITAELRSQVWQVLLDQQLITVDGELPATVDAVVYASAAPEALAEADEDEAEATERAQGLLAVQTSLLRTLAESSLPAVVTAATPGNDASTGILRTVRGDGTFDALSTTDRLQEPDGPLLAVLALIEQLRGGAGAYGTTADAQDRLPALPETEGLAQEAGEQADGDRPAAPSDGGEG